MKKVYIIHGWEGFPENHWFPWLRKKLEEKGFEVIIPEMPNPEEPDIKEWVGKLQAIVKDINGKTYFIGHSIGCQAIMRFLETLPVGSKVRGIIFVAGFFNLPYLETDEEKEIAKPWLETPINTEKIKELTKNIIAIFSDDDPEVALSDSKLFKERLNAEIIVERGKRHFTSGAGVTELPIVLDKLLEISKK